MNGHFSSEIAIRMVHFKANFHSFWDIFLAQKQKKATNCNGCYFYYNFFLAYNFFDWKSEIVTQPGLISKGLKIQGSGFFCGLNIKRS